MLKFTLVVEPEGGKLPQWICDSNLSMKPINGLRIETISIGDIVEKYYQLEGNTQQW